MKLVIIITTMITLIIITLMIRMMIIATIKKCNDNYHNDCHTVTYSVTVIQMV